MEEAFKEVYSGLSYFSGKGILPKELFENDFIQTSAFLYDVRAQRPAVAEVSPAPNPANSFWLVSLSNREVSADVTLNAYTGQIWMADIRSSSHIAAFDNVMAMEVLEQYEAYLGLSGGGGLRSSEEYACKSYDNNRIGIIVQKKPGESRHYEVLHFYLEGARH